MQLEPSVNMGLEIGQKVKVSRLRDRVSKETATYLGKRGVVSQFKMVDGSGVGVVVEFEDRYTTWFFEDELSPVQ
ncbi:cytochrome B6 [filamentous cyanobacterium CCP3]|nr:cytochrome B6 [filamentous cyanobacterium CCP3]